MPEYNILNSQENLSTDTVNLIIKSIRGGDNALKESFICDNKLYITKVVSNVLKKYIETERCEEFSVGLSAFYEAIVNYDQQRNANFYNYSGLVIKHRLTDFKRKNKKHTGLLSLTYLEENDSLNSEILISDSHYQYEKVELKEELSLFEKQLGNFSITLKELISSSPKHKDSRSMCIGIARIISEDDNLYYKLIRRKALPLSDMLKKIKISPKTVERNRKFIIAVSIILRSNLEEMKGLVC